MIKPCIHSSSMNTARAIISRIIQLMDSEPERTFHIAFSGGDTPALMFDLWANEYADKTPWKRLNIWWADEHCVSPKHSDSNYGLMRTLLLDAVSVPEENIYRIRGEEGPINEVRRYSQLVKKHVPEKDNYPIFDIVLLGASKEGSISSIFSGQEQLLASRQIYGVSRDPQDGHTKISLTGYLITKARHVLFLITGKNKAGIVHEICTSGDTSPAAYILHHANNVELFLDAGAASLLKE
ncbi:6-phosphogluconolactonase [termite gut metagenome]|uniref:6-phosphogluconolactonase n=1 Tax=termite gut metagenome TaxID=433724 RepID=A0A5J4SDH3_9ZZZZ